jgi:hypothetical protein
VTSDAKVVKTKMINTETRDSFTQRSPAKMGLNLGMSMGMSLGDSTGLSPLVVPLNVVSNAPVPAVTVPHNYLTQPAHGMSTDRFILSTLFFTPSSQTQITDFSSTISACNEHGLVETKRERDE